MKQLLTIFICTTFYFGSIAQTTTIDFEEISLEQDTFWNGSDLSGGFEIEEVFFSNTWNTMFSYWQAGWALSNKTDSLTGNFTNLFSARPGIGFDGSSNYAIGQQNSVIDLGGSNSPISIQISNTTYAHGSMSNGDGFAKPFGGTSGDDPDFFKLTIKKYLNGELQTDSIEFYLADYRFADNAEDYIINQWETVDLQPLGQADSLLFTLSSSDVGENGINTPLFFAIDQLLVDNLTDVVMLNADIFIQVFPNPTTDNIQLKFDQLHFGQFQIIDFTGKIIQQGYTNTIQSVIPVHSLTNGVYSILWTDRKQTISKTFVKQ